MIECRRRRVDTIIDGRRSCVPINSVLSHGAVIAWLTVEDHSRRRRSITSGD